MLDHTAPQLAPRDRCTGCSACANGCPRGAIHMLPDREGFLYPTVTDACIRCGHCSHICPVLKQREPRPEPAAFAVWNPDDAVRSRSDAGGVFPLLAEFILDDSGVVFGAATDAQLHVRHIAVQNKADLCQLQGEKPVQSEMGDSYALVRRCLERGQRVLFSGTPCQVDGLYRFLGEHPQRLLTVDILCSGVASPGVWEHLVHSMAYIKQKAPISVQFSAKLAGEKDRRFRVSFSGGGVYDAPLSKSELGCGLRQRLFLRPACHTCPYMSCDRTGDLSIGNFCALPPDFMPEEQKKGISLLLVNSPKGAHIFDTLPLKKVGRELSAAIADNPALSAPAAAPQERAAFFDAFAHQSFQQVRHHFLMTSPLSKRRAAQDGQTRRSSPLAFIFRKKEK